MLLQEINHWDTARRLFKADNGSIYGFYKQNGAFKNKEYVKADLSNAEWFIATPDIGEPCHSVDFTNKALVIKELKETK
jgi:hypothetical protein